MLNLVLLFCNVMGLLINPAASCQGASGKFEVLALTTGCTAALQAGGERQALSSICDGLGGRMSLPTYRGS